MSGHTPGPWFVTGSMTKYVEARIGGGVLQEVAACGPTEADGGYGDTQIANARLIAAAPDLYRELAFAVSNEEQSCFEQWLSRVAPGGDCDSVQAQWLESSDYQDFCDLWGGPISAIVRARGEE